MATLKEIILREINPFDPVTFTTGNFWRETPKSENATVDSIHQPQIKQIENTLQYVIRDGYTRSLILTGDSGCGKSYLLSRLKKNLNDRAFFAYIEPCPTNDHIWRHTLRYTVDGLMHVPEGESESQLILWLKGLSAYQGSGGIVERLFGKKNKFIHELKSTYPIGIYQPQDFFSVLYALTNPDLYFSACDWLRGNSLSEEELKALGVNKTVDSEQAAREIIGNFGRISRDNKPIVLCFDQIELAPPSPNGSPNLNPVFNVNTTFHNDKLKNFLVILSITRHQLKFGKSNILQSDLARINQEIVLNQINLDQVEALWANRLYPLHCQAKPQPNSAIEPLNKQYLEQIYPGGKANLRGSLNLGGTLYQKEKDKYIDPKPIYPDPPFEKGIDPLIDWEKSKFAFKLLWRNELNKTKNKISRIRQLSSPELIEMLMTAMDSLGIKIIKTHLLNGKYASYSLRYQANESDYGIMWNEDAEMKSFCHAMKACEKLISSNQNIRLKLIRAQALGKKTTKGYKLYQKIFNNAAHIAPNLESVHYLKTYQKLVNDARSGDFVLNYKLLNLSQLKKLVGETEVLHSCRLLQDLKIVSPADAPPENDPSIKNLQEIKDFVLNIVTVQKFLGEQKLIQQTKSEFSEAKEAEIENMIKQLCNEQQISYINPDAKPQERLLCLVPQKTGGGKRK